MHPNEHGHFGTPDLATLERDLHWIIQSPYLYQHGDITADQLLSTLSTPTNLSGLQDLLDRALTRPRLGYYYEQLLAYLLDTHPQITQLLQNIPVQGTHRTLGEFDLLLKLQDAPRPQHWEVAIKYYLGIGTCAAEYHWVGPGLQDRLDIKLNRLRDHQMQLSQTPDAKAILKDRGFYPIQSGILVKGYLFHPVGLWLSRTTSVPPSINPQHLQGWWATPSDWQHRFREETIRWTVLHKPCWLAPVQCPADNTLSFTEMQQYVLGHLDAHNFPLMIAALAPDDLGQMAEQHRGFLVPEDWPAAAHAIADPEQTKLR